MREAKQRRSARRSAMTIHKRPRRDRRDAADEADLAGSALGRELTRSPERGSSGSRREPAGGRCPVGNSSPRRGAGPASALSSQSGHSCPASSTIQRSDGAGRRRRQRGPGEGGQGVWSPARRSTRAPFHSRKAAPDVLDQGDCRRRRRPTGRPPSRRRRRGTTMAGRQSSRRRRRRRVRRRACRRRRWRPDRAASIRVVGGRRPRSAGRGRPR